MTNPDTEHALFDMPRASPTDLMGRFTIPPFSVFDRRKGYWQDRRRRWMDMGISSDEGRETNLTYVPSKSNDEVSTKIQAIGTTSVFDPVIAETMVRWFSPTNGLVFDPFAGGSVRGIVAHAMGRSYLGCDIRPEQLDANYTQLHEFIAAHGRTAEGTDCQWILQDGTRPFDHDHPTLGGPADLVLTCPPYGDLEVYSDLENDISNMGEDEFGDAYADAVWHATERLADHRYSVWVVGNYRDKRSGHLRDLVGLTIGAHVAAGLAYHAEGIIVDPVGSGAMRASHTFPANRRPIRTHQTILVFVKGDVKQASAACQPFSSAQLDDMWKADL